MKLLYAEDEKSMSEAVTDILAYHNYTVDTVYNGNDALDWAKAEHYDGIILDIMMPGLNGIEVLQQLRKEGVKTPILLLTAKAEIENRIEGLDAGADDYLPKPFNMGELLARVRAMLRRREEFRIRIQEIYDDNNQIFGAAKITAIMKEEGYRISIGMVRELMHDMGLISIRQDAKDLYDKEQKKYKNHLNQEFIATRPNEIWVSDVTYFRWKDKVFYICAILDLYSRMVVGFRISHKNSTQLTKGTFKQAHENRKPESNLLFHTDRGSNYRSNTFCSYLKSLGVNQSFSRAHVPYDNSVMESFFSSLKREELYRTKYRSENEFRTAVKNYMEFYNEKRPHAKNGYKTPAKRELEFFSKQANKSSN